MAEEVAEHVPTLAERGGLDAGLPLAALSVMPVDWQPPEAYESHREEAERRMAQRDPEDWPTVALALAVRSRWRHRLHDRRASRRDPKGGGRVGLVVQSENKLYTRFIPLWPNFSRSQLTRNGLFKPNLTPLDPRRTGS